MRIGYIMQAGVPNVRNYPLSGPANHVKNVIKEFQALGHEVCILAYLENAIWKSYDLNNFEPVVARFFDRGPLRWIERIVRRVQYELKLPYAALFASLRFAQSCIQELNDCDLLYERYGWFGYGGVIACRLSNTPLFLEVNGDLLRELELKGMAPKGLQRIISLRLMKWAMNFPICIVSTGEGWRKRFIEQWKVPEDRVVVIENGSELIGLLKREQIRAFQDSFQADEPVTLVYVGAFEPWHGLPLLIRASARAIRQGLNIRLIIIGSGTEQSNIVNIINELGIQSFVKLTGRLPSWELANHLSQADIGVAPYNDRVEYSGLKLLDYKAAGLPVIASGENGQPALIKHGHTGLIVPPGIERALCDSICQLAKDISLCRKMGRQARLEAEKFHSWKHTAKNLEALFYNHLPGLAESEKWNLRE